MLLVYITYPSQEVAQSVSRALVEARVVACANVFMPHKAMYRWDEAVHEDDEIAVIYKTQQECFQELQDYVIKHHPYDVPCIVALPVEQGSPDFLKWVGAQTEKAR